MFEIKIRVVRRQRHSLGGKYESPISYGMQVKAKVKLFVYAPNIETDTRAVTIAPRIFVPAR